MKLLLLLLFINAGKIAVKEDYSESFMLKTTTTTTEIT